MMILGDIQHYEDERHLYHSSIRKAIDYLVAHNPGAWEPGKYEIDSSLMFVLVQDMLTLSEQELRYESHATYMDIQYLVSGEERIGFVKHSSELQIAEDTLEELDVIFYNHVQRDAETSIVLRPGQFAIFYPSDVHCPCMFVGEPGSIRKIVIKIHKNLWQT
ncbi:YhcH/YjgK/YiaL family protein [Paenibacillus alba]|uniref:YhcH/YjgK/YiaL family protein n=1 Tax=Paenibacillus alba TaxID=1197127 RepID=A0ABU6GAM5_9BACL|nr:YhcH/YjgK/YiaL family protein [Paenibacillus alba]MEC0231030.1 YhcH/YjgK/YiaL family protein [Paenibacillus alba]